MIDVGYIQIVMLMLKIAIFFLVFSLNQACQTHIAFGYSNCAFIVSYPDPSCYNFNFQHCEWTECVSYYTDSQGNSQCDQWHTYTDPSWSACTNRCCDSSVTYSQNSDGIKQCQDYLNARFRLIMAIVFGIIGGVVFIGVICCCCCSGCCSSCRQNIGDCCAGLCQLLRYICTCQCFRRRREMERQEQMRRQEPYTMEMVKPQMQTKPNWQYEGLRNSHLANICSVCLENKPSLELQCGHIYHPKCIIACMKRKEECVLCRSHQFNQIKVYCQTCYNSQYSTTLLENMHRLEQKQECDGCKEANMFSEMKQ